MTTRPAALGTSEDLLLLNHLLYLVGNMIFMFLYILNIWIKFILYSKSVCESPSFEFQLRPLFCRQLTYLHLEVVEGVLVDVFHLVHHPHGVVGQRADVRAPHLVVRGVVEAGRRHVGGADGLDLLQLTELILADDLMWREGLISQASGPETSGLTIRPMSRPHTHLHTTASPRRSRRWSRWAAADTPPPRCWPPAPRRTRRSCWWRRTWRRRTHTTGSRARRCAARAAGSGRPRPWAGCCGAGGGCRPAAPPSPPSPLWPGDEGVTRIKRVHEEDTFISIDVYSTTSSIPTFSFAPSVTELLTWLRLVLIWTNSDSALSWKIKTPPASQCFFRLITCLSSRLGCQHLVMKWTLHCRFE